jgi:hypothetical protein
MFWNLLEKHGFSWIRFLLYISKYIFIEEKDKRTIGKTGVGFFPFGENE